MSLFLVSTSITYALTLAFHLHTKCSCSESLLKERILTKKKEHDFCFLITHSHMVAYKNVLMHTLNYNEITLPCSSSWTPACCTLLSYNHLCTRHVHLAAQALILSSSFHTAVYAIYTSLKNHWRNQRAVLQIHSFPSI